MVLGDRNLMCWACGSEPDLPPCPDCRGKNWNVLVTDRDIERAGLAAWLDDPEKRGAFFGVDREVRAARFEWVPTPWERVRATVGEAVQRFGRWIAGT